MYFFVLWKWYEEKIKGAEYNYTWSSKAWGLCSLFVWVRVFVQSLCCHCFCPTGRWAILPYPWQFCTSVNFLWISVLWTIKLIFLTWKSSLFLMLQIDSTIRVDVNVNFSLDICWFCKWPEGLRISVTRSFVEGKAWESICNRNPLQLLNQIAQISE